MEKIKTNLDFIRKDIVQDDKDYIMCVEGYEGVGKTTLALHICKYIDPTFNVDRIIFNLDDFKMQIKTSKKGNAILIDEGALVMFSRDAMKGEVKELIRLFTAIRQYNLFICICVPRFNIIDRYIREHRVKGLLRVTKRGRFAAYNKQMIDKIHKDKWSSKIIYPRTIFKESFGKFNDMELWTAYIKKKGMVLDESNEVYYTAPQIAKKLNVSNQTIYNYMDRGELEYILKDNGTKKISHIALLAFKRKKKLKL
jgi:hypothetical protein